MLYESDPPGYDVEFTDSKGLTIALLTLHDEDLEGLDDKNTPRHNPAG